MRSSEWIGGHKVPCSDDTLHRCLILSTFHGVAGKRHVYGLIAHFVLADVTAAAALGSTGCVPAK